MAKLARTKAERDEILRLVLKPLIELRREVDATEQSKLPDPPKRDLETLERVVGRLVEAGWNVSVMERYNSCGPTVNVSLKSDHPAREEARKDTEAAKEEVIEAIDGIRRAVLFSDNYDAEGLDLQARDMAGKLRKQLGL